MNRKGQLFSGDMIVSVLIFMAGLALAFFLWNSVNDEIRVAEELRSLEELSSGAVEQLIRTEGSPSDWNVYTVKVPGLVNDGRTINQTKALNFMELMNSTNYDSNLHKMGLGPYEFYMNVTDLDDDVIVLGGEDFVAGKLPVDEDYSIAMFRTGIFNDTIVRINFIMWR